MAPLEVAPLVRIDDRMGLASSICDMSLSVPKRVPMAKTGDFARIQSEPDTRAPKNRSTTSQGFPFDIKDGDGNAEFLCHFKKVFVLAKGWIHDKMNQQP